MRLSFLFILLITSQLNAQTTSLGDQLANAKKRLDGNPTDVRAALDIFAHIEQEAVRLKDERLATYSRWKQGQSYRRLGDEDRARTTLRHAIDLAPTGKAVALYPLAELAECYLEAREAIHARPLLDKALKLAKDPSAIQDRPHETERLRLELEHAQCLVILGENAAALAQLDRLEPVIRAGRNPKSSSQRPWEYLHAEHALQLAELERRTNTLAANERLELALEILHKIPSADSTRLQYRCHVNIAMNLWRLTRFEEAERRLEAARGLIPQRDAATLDEHRAALRIEWGNYLFEQEPNSRTLPSMLDDAERMLRRGLELHERHGHRRVFAATSHFNLAQVHELRGRMLQRSGDAAAARLEFTRADEACDRAVPLLAPAFPEGHDYVLEMRRKKAWLRLRLGDLVEARREAQDTLRKFEAAHGVDHVDGGLFHSLLLAIEDEAGNGNEAASHADRHRRLVAQRLLDHSGALTAPEQVQFFRKWDDPGLHAALNLGTRHPALGDRSAEWLINGKAKLVETLAQIPLRNRGGPEYRSFQQAITRQTALLYAPNLADPPTLQRELLREEGNKRRIVLSAQAPASNASWRAITDLRRRLAPDEVFVSIFCLRSDPNGASHVRKYFAWVITADDTGPAAVIRLGDAATIDRLVREFSEHQANYWTRPDGTEGLFHTLGEQPAEAKLLRECLTPLADLVLRPLLPHAKGRNKWIISPDGGLWNLPWAALPLREGRYAIEDYSFRYVMSGRELMDTPSPAPPGPALVLDDPDFGPLPAMPGERTALGNRLLFGPLAASAEEGKFVASALGKLSGVTVTRLTGAKATREALMGVQRPPRVLHLSTHSVFHPQNLRVDDPLLFCAIALAGWNQGKGDLGGLSAAQVVGLNLRGTELVVLSSCQSGVGVLDYGQRSADLRHAFHLAGARGVVSALWSVHDRATKDLMISFTRALAGRELTARAEALRDAQLAMIAAQRLDGASHPFWWAGFTLSGS